MMPMTVFLLTHISGTYWFGLAVTDERNNSASYNMLRACTETNTYDVTVTDCNSGLTWSRYSKRDRYCQSAADATWAGFNPPFGTQPGWCGVLLSSLPYGTWRYPTRTEWLNILNSRSSWLGWRDRFEHDDSAIYAISSTCVVNNTDTACRTLEHDSHSDSQTRYRINISTGVIDTFMERSMDSSGDYALWAVQ